MHPEPTRAGSTGPMRMRCVTWTRRGDAEPMDAFTSLAATFSNSGVLYVVIGAWGANYYAPSGGTMFMTLDRDIFLPADPDNLLAAWHACEASGFGLFAGAGPLDMPRDVALARAVVGRRALTRASGDRGTDVDLSLVMSGFEFETVWWARRLFEVDGVVIPVARLAHIVESKATAGREKDQLFLSMHREALERLLSDEDSDA